MAHEIRINNSTYYVQGNDTETLKLVCEVNNFKYDKLEPTKLSELQKVVRIWAIGELIDYLKSPMRISELVDHFKMKPTYGGFEKVKQEILKLDSKATFEGSMINTRLSYDTINDIINSCGD